MACGLVMLMFTGLSKGWLWLCRLRRDF